MNSHEIISFYERLSGLTAQMAEAAHAKNWNNFAQLESQCAIQIDEAKTRKPTPLTGMPLQRKISLLKEIMAHDRRIREITDSWQQQLPATMQH